MEEPKSEYYSIKSDVEIKLEDGRVLFTTYDIRKISYWENTSFGNFLSGSVYMSPGSQWVRNVDGSVKKCSHLALMCSNKLEKMHDEL